MVPKKAPLVGLALLAVLASAGVAATRRPADGPLLRTITLGADPGNVAVDGATGHAFVVDRNTNGYAALGQGTVSLVDTRAGRLLRTTPVGPDPREAVIDTRNGHVLVANDDNASVSILDARSGRSLGAVRVGSHPHSMAVDARAGRAFVVNSGDGSVSVLDTRRAVVLGAVHLAGDFALSGVAVDERAGRVFVGDTGGGAGLVHVLDAHLGADPHAAIRGAARATTIRPYATGSYATGSYATGSYATGSYATGSYATGSYLSSLDRMDHMVVDSTPVTGAPDGRVFATNGAGLSVLDARGGQILRTIPVRGAASAIAVDQSRHRVYVTSIDGVDGNGSPAGPGRLTVLDELDGRVLRTVDAGMTPRAVAVDAGTGHVVVVDEGGSMAIPNAWAWVPQAIRQRVPFLNSPVRTRAVPAGISVLDMDR